MVHKETNSQPEQSEEHQNTRSGMISSIVVALVFVLIALPGIITAAVEAPSTGSFTVNNESPTISSVQLWSTGTSPAQSTSMTPQVEYNVKIAVTDTNTLTDMYSVKVTIYYDADGTYNPSDRPSSGDTQTAAILTWTNGGGWSIDPSSSTTWSINSGSSSAPSLGNSVGTFEFHFTPGKVAIETPGTAEWHIYALATDGDSGTGDNSQDDREMNWYGEITSVTGTTSFGTVPLGCSGSPSSAVSTTYIANGAYDEQVKSDATWIGQDTGATAALYTSGTGPGETQLALKADNDSTLANSTQVINADYVSINNSGTQTAESGYTQDNNHLWLWLGSSSLLDEEYQGTIYFKIADGS